MCKSNHTHPRNHPNTEDPPWRLTCWERVPPKPTITLKIKWRELMSRPGNQDDASKSIGETLLLLSQSLPVLYCSDPLMLALSPDVSSHWTMTFVPMLSSHI